MLIAKTTEKHGEPHYREVVKVGRVLFDHRDGWVLLSEPLGARPRKRVLQWMHPDDVRFEWVRKFAFSNAKISRPREAGTGTPEA